MKRRNRLLAASVAAVLIAATVSTTGASADPNGRHGGGGGYVAIPGTAYVMQPGDVDLGRDLTDTVRFEIALKVQNVDAEKALAYAVSDPTSPQYGRFLSPQRFRRLFSPSDRVASQIENWLESANMTVLDDPANHLTITAEGTGAAADQAFQTDLHVIKAKDGNIAIEPLRPLSVPAKVADSVDGFIEGGAFPLRLAKPDHRTGDTTHDGANNTPDTTRSRAVANDAITAAPPAPVFVNAPPCSAYWGEKTASGLPDVPADYAKPVPYVPCGYTGTQLRGAYGTAALSQQGINGRGVTVAITDAYASPTIAGDAATYAAKNGDAPWGNKFRQITPTSERYGYNDSVNGDQCGEQGWYGEETLDVEAVHAMAPAANVLYVGASSCADGDLLKALNKIVDGHQADIITNSWGGSNEIIDPVLLDVYNAVFVQAALEGIGVFYSSGDNGDEVDNGGTRTVDMPASDPWVTAVGGTSIGIGRQNNYLFETGWGTSRSILTNGAWSPTPPGTHVYGAGGGTSQLFAQPPYQRGVVPSSIANYFATGTPGRAVPDIATIADPQTGFLVGQTQTFPDGSTKYSEYRIGGTSLASPVMAGIEALSDQASGHAHGFANPAIYRLRPDAVHDVVNPPQTVSAVRVDFINTVDASGGLRTSLRTMNQTESIFTRPGYDDVTGIGSPNGAGYVLALGRRR